MKVKGQRPLMWESKHQNLLSLVSIHISAPPIKPHHVQTHSIEHARCVTWEHLCVSHNTNLTILWTQTFFHVSELWITFLIRYRSTRDLFCWKESWLNTIVRLKPFYCIIQPGDLDTGASSLHSPHDHFKSSEVFSPASIWKTNTDVFKTTEIFIHRAGQ